MDFDLTTMEEAHLQTMKTLSHLNQEWGMELAEVLAVVKEAKEHYSKDIHKFWSELASMKELMKIETTNVWNNQ